MADARPKLHLPCPPDDLSAPGRNAWHRLYVLHAGRGTWTDLYLLDLHLLAHACGWYVEAARALRGLAPATPAHPDAGPALETGRRLARSYLVDWGWLAPENQHLAVVDPDGLDAELVALCAPLGEGAGCAEYGIPPSV